MDENIDYSELGLKIGLEIHQQLNTKKLFCNCPSLLRKDEPDYTFTRRLHVVAGESGEIDVAARHEAEQDREFIYQGYKDSNCLVEMDEEPPHKINPEALRIALQVALLLNCKIFSISQIMRKTVIDGSNTSGFQRTVLIARGGYVETSYGKIGIESIALEEDSARAVKREKDRVIYRIDRLGIPLIEIATSPDIKTPEQAKEVALHIGNVLRSCKVKRGLGTIRQDVNVSIAKGARVEIKGFQDVNLFIKTINSEIKRQEALISHGKKVKQEVRMALPDGNTEFLRPMPGAARMYPETDLPLLKISRDLINDIKKTLPKLRSELEEELRKKGLSQDMIKLIFKEDKLEEFKELLKIINNPQLITKVLLLYPKEISRKENIDIKKINKKLEDNLSGILEELKKGSISESQIKNVMLDIVKGKSFKEAIKFEKVDITDIEEKILKIIKSKPGLRENAYMGLVMKELDLKGKISGKEVMEIIGKYMK